jgi:hypothetical protein
MEQQNTPEKSGFPLWTKIAGGLGVLAVIVGGGQNLGKIWEFIRSVCCVDETPHVRVTKEAAKWGGECLQFEFSNLPANFRLSEIRLTIENPKIANLPGDQAASLLQATVATLIDDDNIIQKEPIRIKCRIAATEEKDAFSVTYCPVLKQRGEYGSFKTRPLFFAVDDDKPLSKIRVALEGEAKALDITTKHPKNLEVLLSPDLASDCSRASQK